jgi:hypothetical protein
MAISRGAGTEIIRTHLFEATSTVGAGTSLIIGVQHHIYTVLSAIFFCNARSGTEGGHLKLTGWDSFGGASAQTIHISTINLATGETFIWNDKFSFNGTEPTGASGRFGAGDDAADLAYQEAIADQGGSVIQRLDFGHDSTSTTYDICITFIDQNNA